MAFLTGWSQSTVAARMRLLIVCVLALMTLWSAGRIQTSSVAAGAFSPLLHAKTRPPRTVSTASVSPGHDVLLGAHVLAGARGWQTSYVDPQHSNNRSLFVESMHGALNLARCAFVRVWRAVWAVGSPARISPAVSLP